MCHLLIFHDQRMSDDKHSAWKIMAIWSELIHTIFKWQSISQYYEPALYNDLLNNFPSFWPKRLIVKVSAKCKITTVSKYIIFVTHILAIFPLQKILNSVNGTDGLILTHTRTLTSQSTDSNSGTCSIANHHRMARTIPELTHIIPCPRPSQICPGIVYYEGVHLRQWFLASVFLTTVVTW